MSKKPFRNASVKNKKVEKALARRRPDIPGVPASFEKGNGRFVRIILEQTEEESMGGGGDRDLPLSPSEFCLADDEASDSPAAALSPPSSSNLLASTQRETQQMAEEPRVQRQQRRRRRATARERSRSAARFLRQRPEQESSSSESHSSYLAREREKRRLNWRRGEEESPEQQPVSFISPSTNCPECGIRRRDARLVHRIPGGRSSTCVAACLPCSLTLFYSGSVCPACREPVVRVIAGTD